MYIPVFKNRLFENKFLREQQQYFNDEIIPMIEVLNIKIGRTKMSIEEMLTIYDSYFSSPYLIDYFIFEESEYSKYDATQIEFSIEQRKHTWLDYKQNLEYVTNTKYGIPVISIKKGREILLNNTLIKDLIKDLQSKKESICVRIQAELLNDYFIEIDQSLRDEDILIYDINEEPIQSKYFDRKLLRSKKNEYQTVVLHSPRSSKIINSSYIDGEYTGLIDNSMTRQYAALDFDGFADYAGLKNVLPTDGGNGQGAALGLFYDKNANQFFSIMNKKTSEGTRGHNYVLKCAFDDYKEILNPFGDCPAYIYMKENLLDKESAGSWGQWKYITILRYISQIKNSL